jgi:AcrR family transcriptional regulator
MVRRYDMTNRGRAAGQTRSAILEAAHGLLNRGDGGTLALHEVAAAARVSRATIYNSVGSRRDLLAAVFEDQGRLIQFDRVLAAIHLPDPGKAVRATVRESCRAWSVMPDALRRTLALAAMDREIGDLVEKYERYRRDELTGLARRAHKAGVLGDGSSVKYAAATLAVLTGFPAFDQLRLEYDPATAAALLVWITEASLGIGPDQE